MPEGRRAGESVSRRVPGYPGEKAGIWVKSQLMREKIKQMAPRMGDLLDFLAH